MQRNAIQYNERFVLLRCSLLLSRNVTSCESEPRLHPQWSDGLAQEQEFQH